MPLSSAASFGELQLDHLPAIIIRLLLVLAGSNSRYFSTRQSRGRKKCISRDGQRYLPLPSINRLQ